MSLNQPALPQGLLQPFEYDESSWMRKGMILSRANSLDEYVSKGNTDVASFIQSKQLDQATIAMIEQLKNEAFMQFDKYYKLHEYVNVRLGPLNHILAELEKNGVSVVEFNRLIAGKNSEIERLREALASCQHAYGEVLQSRTDGMDLGTVVQMTDGTVSSEADELARCRAENETIRDRSLALQNFGEGCRNDLETCKKKISDAHTDRDPVWMDLKLSLMRSIAKIEELSAKLQTLESQQRNYKQDKETLVNRLSDAAQQCDAKLLLHRESYINELAAQESARLEMQKELQRVDSEMAEARNGLEQDRRELQEKYDEEQHRLVHEFSKRFEEVSVAERQNAEHLAKENRIITEKLLQGEEELRLQHKAIHDAQSKVESLTGLLAAEKENLEKAKTSLSAQEDVLREISARDKVNDTLRENLREYEDIAVFAKEKIESLQRSVGSCQEEFSNMMISMQRELESARKRGDEMEVTITEANGRAEKLAKAYKNARLKSQKAAREAIKNAESLIAMRDRLTSLARLSVATGAVIEDTRGAVERGRFSQKDIIDISSAFRSYLRRMG